MGDPDYRAADLQNGRGRLAVGGHCRRQIRPGPRYFHGGIGLQVVEDARAGGRQARQARSLIGGPHSRSQNVSHAVTGFRKGVIAGHANVIVPGIAIQGGPAVYVKRAVTRRIANRQIPDRKDDPLIEALDAIVERR